MSFYIRLTIYQNIKKTTTKKSKKKKYSIFLWISKNYNNFMKPGAYDYSEHLQHMSRLMTKPTKWHVRPAKIQISLGIRPDWSESSLSAWRKLGSSATHWAHNEDSDQTGRMPRLIWVFAGRTCLFVGCSYIFMKNLRNYPSIIIKYPPYLFFDHIF